MSGPHEQARLAWQCRRGMLELDLSLQNFLDHHYVQLDSSRRAAFVRLLDYPDELLFEYIMGRILPTDPVDADVIAHIRTAATS